MSLSNLGTSLLNKESGGNYRAINSLGYIGGYQFGAQALETLGYLKKGASRFGNSALDNISNWTGKSGVNSKESFLNNPAIQDAALQENFEFNRKVLENRGIIDENTSDEDVLGYLAASHLLGAPQVASNLNATDANGVSGQEYFQLGRDSFTQREPLQPINWSQPKASQDVGSGMVSRDNPYFAELNQQLLRTPESKTRDADLERLRTPRPGEDQIVSTPVSGFAEITAAGFDTTVEQLGVDWEYFKALGNTLLGDERAAARNIEEARVREEFAAVPLQSVESFERFFDEPTVEGFFTQVAKAPGLVAPYILTSITGAGVGALAAVTGKGLLTATSRATAKRVIRESAEKVAKDEATPDEKELVQRSYDALRGYRSAAVKGAIAGAGGAEYVPMASSNFAEALEAGEEPDRGTALRASAVAFPQAAVGVGGEVLVAKALLNVAKKRSTNSNSVMGRLAADISKSTLRSGTVGATTEFVQEGIGVANRMDLDDEYSSQDAQLRLAEAAFMGFFGEGAFGAAGGTAAGAFREITNPDTAYMKSLTSSVLDKSKELVERGRDVTVGKIFDREQYGDLATGLTSPEPESDIQAQLDAMTIDGSSQKNAVWIAGNTPEKGADRNGEITPIVVNGYEAFAAFIPTRGTIISTSREIAQAVVNDGASDKSLQLALGYSGVKDVESGQDIVYQAQDKDGNVVSEELTTAENAEAAQAAATRLMPEGGSVVQTNVQEALERRKKKLDAEQAILETAAEVGTAKDAASGDSTERSRAPDSSDISDKAWMAGDNLNALEELFYTDRPELLDAPQTAVTLEEQARERFQDDKAEGVQGQEEVYTYTPRQEGQILYDSLVEQREKFQDLFGEVNWEADIAKLVSEAALKKLIGLLTNESTKNNITGFRVTTVDGKEQLEIFTYNPADVDLFNFQDEKGQTLERQVSIERFLELAVDKATKGIYVENSKVTLVRPEGGKQFNVNLADLTRSGQRIVEQKTGRFSRQSREGFLAITNELLLAGYEIRFDGKTLQEYGVTFFADEKKNLRVFKGRNPKTVVDAPQLRKIDDVTAAVEGKKLISVGELLQEVDKRSEAKKVADLLESGPVEDTQSKTGWSISFEEAAQYAQDTEMEAGLQPEEQFIKDTFEQTGGGRVEWDIEAEKPVLQPRETETDGPFTGVGEKWTAVTRGADRSRTADNSLARFANFFGFTFDAARSLIGDPSRGMAGNPIAVSALTALDEAQSDTPTSQLSKPARTIRLFIRREARERAGQLNLNTLDLSEIIPEATKQQLYQVVSEQIEQEPGLQETFGQEISGQQEMNISAPETTTPETTTPEARQSNTRYVEGRAPRPRSGGPVTSEAVTEPEAEAVTEAEAEAVTEPEPEAVIEPEAEGGTVPPPDDEMAGGAGERTDVPPIEEEYYNVDSEAENLELPNNYGIKDPVVLSFVQELLDYLGLDIRPDIFTTELLESNVQYLDYLRHSLGEDKYEGVIDFIRQTQEARRQVENGGSQTGAVGRTIYHTHDGKKSTILLRTGVQPNPLVEIQVAFHEIGHALWHSLKEDLLKNSPEIIHRLYDDFRKHPAYDRYMAMFSTDEDFQFQNAFHEFFADQVAKAGSKKFKGKKPKNITQKIYADFAAKLRNFWRKGNQLLKSYYLQGRFGGLEAPPLDQEFDPSNPNNPLSADFEIFIDAIAKRNKEGEALSPDMWVQKTLAREMDQVNRKKMGPALEQAITYIKNLVDRIVKGDEIKGPYALFATADSYLRLVAGNEIADLFYLRAQKIRDNVTSATGSLLGMVGELGRQRDILNTKFIEMVGQPSDQAVIDALEEAYSSFPDSQISEKARQVRAFYREVYTSYIEPSNSRIRQAENYTPTVLDLEKIALNPDEFINLILKETNQLNDPKARALVRKVVVEIIQEDDGVLDHLQESVWKMNPQRTVEKQRVLTAGIAPQKLRAFSRPPIEAHVEYIKNLTRRVEWNRHTKNEQSQDILGPMLEKLSSENRDKARQVIETYLGYQKSPMSPFWRGVNSWAQVAQFYMTIPFAVLASLTEFAGPMIRSKELTGLVDGYKTIISTIKDKKEAEILARDLGVISTETIATVFLTEADRQFMTESARNASDAFFKYTGLTGFTKFTRVFASKMAINFVIRHSDPSTMNENSLRYLEELGVTPEDVKVWLRSDRNMETDEGKKVGKAISRFVEDSILRPNAAERPLWASDPRFALIWQLKGFFWSYGKVIMAGVAREARTRLNNGETVAAGYTSTAALLALAAVATLPLAMLGMELREYAKYTLAAVTPGIDTSNRYFRSDKMDWPTYMAEIVDRSGVYGPFTILAMMQQKAEWGKSPITPIFGPTAEMVETIIENGFDVGKTVRHRLMPIVNQI